MPDRITTTVSGGVCGVKGDATSYRSRDPHRAAEQSREIMVEVKEGKAKEAIERLGRRQGRKDNEVDELMTRGMLTRRRHVRQLPTYVHGHDEYGHPVISEHPTLVNTAGLKLRDGPRISCVIALVMETLEYAKSHARCAHTVYKRRHHRFGA